MRIHTTTRQPTADRRAVLLLWIVSAFILLPLRAFASDVDPPWNKEIGPVPVALEGGSWVSEWREVNLPRGLISFQILVMGSPETLVQITDLVAPDGTIYVRSSPTAPGPLTVYSEPVLSNVLSPNRSEAVSPGLGSLIVPNNPRLRKLKAGKWRFRALSHHEPSVHAVSFQVIGKQANERNKNKIQARVWIAPESYWSSKDHHVDLLMKAVTRLLKVELNLNLKILSTYSLPMKPKSPMSLPADTANIALKLNDLNSLNIYLLPTMEFQSKPINGLACLGGPLETKAPHPCFVSVYADANAGSLSTETQAQIVVHEIGHYLGLFHTRDEGYVGIGTVFDSLSDTSENPTGRNFMDPGIARKHPHFSPLQKEMVLLSPILK